MKNKMEISPQQIFREEEAIKTYKSGLGRLGLYEQSKKNERFYTGDQWKYARVGKDKPLISHNLIKRIGEYKVSVVSASPVSVRISAQGVPNTVGVSKKYNGLKEKLFDSEAQATDDYGNPLFDENGQPIMNEAVVNGEQVDEIIESEFAGLDDDEKINFVMDAMSDYYKVTAERTKFTDKSINALKNAYVSGTGAIYSYWDDKIETGLYADANKEVAIKGDVQCEVIDIENISFGDVNEYEVQNQPFIIISQRKRVSELKKEAEADGLSDDEIELIKPDDDYNDDEYSGETINAKKVTVLTKLFKAENEDGTTTIHAVKVTKNAFVRKEWDTKLRLYPLAIVRWDDRKNNIYGESEVTYLIPNQIAINRMLTASVWAVMQLGMPIMVVNEDVVSGPITNAPGQVLKVSGDVADTQNAIGYVVPPNFSAQMDNLVQSVITNTMNMSGANNAALGDLKADNTSAIIAVREAATMPLQLQQNRYYQFVEDIARIWCEMWLQLYGDRKIKIEDGTNYAYIPFNADEYKNLVLSVVVDVGASTIWSEANSITTLSNMLQAGLIDVVQYLERLPKGTIPELQKLIKEKKQEIKDAQEAQARQQQAELEAAYTQKPDVASVLDELSPEEMEVFKNLSEDEQTEMLKNAMAGGASE